MHVARWNLSSPLRFVACAMMTRRTMVQGFMNCWCRLSWLRQTLSCNWTWSETKANCLRAACVAWLPSATFAVLGGDLCAPRRDHVAVVARFKFPVLHDDGVLPCLRRPCMCDPSGTQDPLSLEAFEHQLSCFPSLPEEN